MAQLAKGLNATGIVLEIEDNFDRFQDTKSDVGGTRFCHKVYVRVDDEEYICQYCSQHPKLSEFAANDTIHFNVKSFSKDIHTIGLISVKKAQAGRVTDPLAFEPVLRHLNLAGTPEALGLQASVNYHCYRPESKLEDITDMAHELTKWLRTEYELNT